MALFTRDIFAHNITIKRYCDKCIFNSHGEKKYLLKNIFLSQYLFIFLSQYRTIVRQNVVCELGLTVSVKTIGLIEFR